MERRVRLTINASASAGAVPTEFRLLKRGVNSYSHVDGLDGDTIVFDDDAAKETMARYRARGLELMADYEHQSLQEPPQIAPASAKRWVPEVRGDGLYATQIVWTDRARQMLAAGEYRYFSIACLVDKTQRCVEVINFALTNNPAGNFIAPLVAASRTPKRTEPKPTNVRKLTAGERVAARLISATDAEFVGLTAAYTKLAGADTHALASADVSPEEERFARKLGIPPKAYAEHKAKLRAQIGIDKK